MCAGCGNKGNKTANSTILKQLKQKQQQAQSKPQAQIKINPIKIKGDTSGQIYYPRINQ